MTGPIELRPFTYVAFNLFLATVPVVLAFFIAFGIKLDVKAHRARWLIWAPLLVLWSVFLPNTCYLLTEWRHYLDTITKSQIYFVARYNHDAVVNFLILTGFYIFYRGSGLLAFFLSIWPLDRLARRKLSAQITIIKIIGFPLCALGVYLGLIRRYNSWDVVHRHFISNIITDAGEALSHPFSLILIVGLAVVLWVLYLAFDIWMDGLAWRRREYIAGKA